MIVFFRAYLLLVFGVLGFGNGAEGWAETSETTPWKENIRSHLNRGAFVSARIELGKVRDQASDPEYQTLCQETLTLASHFFAFDEVHRLMFQGGCQEIPAQVVADGLVFLSLHQNKSLLSLFLEWYKKRLSDEGRWRVLQWVIPPARLTHTQVTEMIQVMKRKEFKRAAFVWYASHFPLPEVLKDHVSYLETVDSEQKSLNRWIEAAYRASGVSSGMVKEVSSLLKTCIESEDPKEKLSAYWRSVCCYYLATRLTSPPAELRQWIKNNPDMHAIAIAYRMNQFPSDQLRMLVP
jgi:hypothetical protein